MPKYPVEWNGEYFRKIRTKNRKEKKTEQMKERNNKM